MVAALSTLAGLVGCAPVAAVVGFTIAATTFAFVLGETGIIEARAGGDVSRKGGVVSLPFDDIPVDRPGSATLDLDVGSTRALLLDGASKRTTHQGITGTARVSVFIGAASASNPCTQGTRVGTYELSFTNGQVSVANPSLALPSDALEHAISGTFTICLEVTTTVDVKLVIGGMSVTFGPVGGTPADSPPDDPAPTPTQDPTPDPTPDPNSTPDPGPGTTPDPTADPAAFRAAEISHRGFERIIAGRNASAETGFVIPEKFNVGRLAISGDGQYVWFYLYWDSISTKPADWIQLYRIHVNGTGLERSYIVEEAAAMGGGFLATNYDGSTAVFEMQRCEPAGVFCRGESRFLRLTPGQPAAAFYDTESDAGLPSTTGPRMTHDGTQIFWHNTERFWSISTSGGIALELASVAHLNFYGPWDPFTGGQIVGLDSSGDGSQWMLCIRFVDPDTNQLRWELIRAAGALPQNIAGLPKQTSQPLDGYAHMSDDGTVVGYAESSAFGTGGSFVQSAAFSSDLRSAAAPTALGAYGMILADDGHTAFCELNFNNERTPVLNNLTTNTRRRAGTTRYTRIEGGVYHRLLSDDGQACIGLWNARGIGTPLNNVYVLRDGATAPADYPQFMSVSYRYDDEAGTLIVRASVTNTSGLERIYLLPHKNGVEPLGAVETAVNPFFNERGGGGVNLSTVLTPVEGETGVYERSIGLGGKKAFIDASYSLRLIAVDTTGTRTSFCDMTPLP
jgi:hypothetical protein